jgi:hypothetical protein
MVLRQEVRMASQEAINLLLEPLQEEIQHFNMLEEHSQLLVVVMVVVPIGVIRLITVMAALGDQVVALQDIAMETQGVVELEHLAKVMRAAAVKANTMRVVVVVQEVQADQDEAMEVLMAA